MMMSLTSSQSSTVPLHGNPYLDKTQCRTCLAAMDRNQHYLFEQVAIGDDMVQTASIIMACASVQILVNDFYPQYICRACLNDAISSFTFRSKCELSQQRLLEASHVGTLKVETTTHLPTLQASPFKVETVDAYEVDVHRVQEEDDDDAGEVDRGESDDDYVPGDTYGGEVSSDDEVLAKKVEKRDTRSSPRVSTTPTTRKRKSTPPSSVPISVASSPASYFCRQCDAVFPTRPAFTAHRDTHASFICRWCVGTAPSKIAFASYETLLAHMRKKHRVEYQRQGEMLDTNSGMQEEEDEELAAEEKGAAKRRKVAAISPKKAVKKVKKKVDVAAIKTEELDDDDENEAPSDGDPHQSSTPTAHQCHYCYKYYTSVSHLNAHIAYCGSTSTSAVASGLAAIAPATTAGGSAPSKFTCNVCSRHFRTFRAVTEHKRSHKGGVFCPYCGLHMLARSMLNHRKREHGTEKEAVCEMCQGVYQGVDELEEHLISHKTFSCADCVYTTKYIDDYRLHLLSHELKTFAETEDGKCRECGEETAGTLALIQHYKTHTMVTCQECETNYGNMVHLHRHTIKAHSDIDTTISEEKRKCTVCAKQFLTVEGMWQHRAKHNTEAGKDGETTGDLFCAYCDFRPKSNVSLGKHMQEEHHSQKTETCSVCDKSFFSAGKLKVHMLTHNADKQHVCEVCGAGFALKGNLNVHMRVHTGEKPYKCEICGYRCTQEGSLTVHMRIHDLVRQAASMCEVCGRTFTRKSQWHSHAKTAHTGARPYPCTECRLTFKERDALKRHMLIHSDTQSYVCPYCDKAFKRRSSRSIHVKIHTGERPHVCPICGKGFLQKHVRDSHMKVHGVSRL